MNKLFKMLQESFGNPPQRNGFDLSRRNIFSTKVGYKVPCFVLETVPNDFHEIRPVNLIRTEPFNELNFVRMKQHMDFYFVPMTAFQTNFHEVLQQTTDPVNSLMVGDVVKNIPVFPLEGLLLAIVYTHYIATHQNDIPVGGFDVESFLTNVLAQAGTDLDIKFQENDTLKYADMFLYNIGGQIPALDMFGEPIYLGAVRLLDMLGYGNFIDLVRPVIPNPDAGVEDMYDDYKYKELLSVILNQSLGKKVNLYRLAAYQCVYQNFGINTTYDKLNVYSFNFDDVVRSNGDWWSRVDSSASLHFEKLQCIFELRYSQWKKDIFTSAYPDSQFGGVSVVSTHTLGVAQDAPSSTSNWLRFTQSHGVAISPSSSANYTSVDLQSQFSILDLRRAEALQGWKEDMMRSGFRAKQRQKSQFGVAPSYDPHCMPYVLGSVSSDIQKDPVTGTAGDQFAELAATGMSTMGNDVIKFDGSGTNDFGIIIGIMSIIPEADYDSFGIDMHNMKSEAFDFYTPAFQNIGLQSLPGDYLNFILAGRDSTLSVPKIFGYVPRYSEYKQMFDKVHGEFCRTVWRYALSDYNYDGVFRDFVSTRFDMESHGLTQLASLYVNPQVVASIFKNTQVDHRQSTDQFKVNAYFDVKSVRPMSVLGLPRW